MQSIRMDGYILLAKANDEEVASKIKDFEKLFDCKPAMYVNGSAFDLEGNPQALLRYHRVIVWSKDHALIETDEGLKNVRPDGVWRYVKFCLEAKEE